MGQVIFVNRKTGHQSPTKPKDWDGHYIIGQGPTKDPDYLKTFGDYSKMFCTPLDEPEKLT